MAEFCVPPSASRAKLGRCVLLAAVSVTALFGGCSDMAPTDFSSLVPASEATERSGQPQSIIALKAAYDTAPDNPQAAVAYAQALKQMGSRDEAYTVLKTAMRSGSDDKALLSEYGRSALEMNDVGVAKEALAKADDPQNPDWRIVMARGTALAKEGHYQTALPFFERAYALEPTHPSVLSNLALAYTMTGQAEKGEPLLRNAIASGSTDPRVKQNLALVLKVQGKKQDAAAVAAAEVKPTAAERPKDEQKATAAAVGVSNITTSSIGGISTGEDAPLPPIPVAASPQHDEDYATDTAE